MERAGRRPPLLDITGVKGIVSLIQNYNITEKNCTEENPDTSSTTLFNKCPCFLSAITQIDWNPDWILIQLSQWTRNRKKKFLLTSPNVLCRCLKDIQDEFSFCHLVWIRIGIGSGFSTAWIGSGFSESGSKNIGQNSYRNLRGGGVKCGGRWKGPRIFLICNDFSMDKAKSCDLREVPVCGGPVLENCTGCSLSHVSSGLRLAVLSTWCKNSPDPTQ